MTYTLVRDNWPRLVEGSTKKALNYAAIQNKEFFVTCLKQKLADEMNAFLNDEEVNVDRLINAEVIIRTLYMQEGVSGEEFESKYIKSIEYYGYFNNKYIAFYPDVIQSDDNVADQSKEKEELR